MADSMDQDTKDILAEMEAEGIDTSSLTDGERVAPATRSEVITPDDEDEADDDESDAEDEEEDVVDPALDESEEESEDDESEEEDEEPVTPKKGKKSVLDKYRDSRKKIRELNDTIAALQNAKSDELFDAEIKAFAEKNSMDVEVAKGLIDFAARKAQLPKAILEDIKRSREERQQAEYWTSQHKGFEREFRGSVVPVLESQGLSKAAIQEVYETLNGDEQSPFWAWDKKNQGKSLVKLALDMQDGKASKGNRVSSESSKPNRRRSNNSAEKDPAEMTPEDIDDMSDEDFDNFSDKLGKGQKSVITRH